MTINIVDTPPTLNYTFTGGDTLKIPIRIEDKDLDNPELPPVVRDLTGWTALAQVRKTSTAAEPLTSFEVTNEPLGPDGEIRLRLSPAQTATLMAEKTCVSDLQLTDPDGEVDTVLIINLNLSQDTSR